MPQVSWARGLAASVARPVPQAAWAQGPAVVQRLMSAAVARPVRARELPLLSFLLRTRVSSFHP